MTVFVLAAVVASCAASECDSRARAIVAQLTLEEKAACMCYTQPEINRLNVPEYNWWNEALHGVARTGLATVFPQAIGRAATFDVGLEEHIGRVVATEARAKYNLFVARGMHMRYCGVNLLSPNVNMFRDPRWGRGQETYGEDPFLTGMMGGAYVRGIQAREGGVMKACACAKHFAVHSGPEAGRMKFSVNVTERDLREYYLPAFRALVMDAGVETVMSSYNAVNGVPLTANRRLLTDVLRGEWGFGGVVVSDAGATDYLVAGHHLGAPAEAVALAEESGLDLSIDWMNTNLVAAVRSGRIPESDLDCHLTRLFALRMRLGLLQENGGDAFSSLGAAAVATVENRALARICAEKSLVLVSNRNNALPLDPMKVQAVCVTGPRAIDAVALYGNYNGYGAKSGCVINGFCEEVGPGLIVRDGHEWYRESDKDCDAWVVCVGITPDMEGEGDSGDRTYYGIGAAQFELIRKLRNEAPDKKLIAVVFGGSPIDLAPLEETCDAVILAWYPGEEGGRAIAGAVFGRVNPAGRIPVTFPKSYDDLPSFETYAVEGRTYRYATKAPLHPFGYGLSYTTFAYSDIAWDGNNIRVRVTNTGVRDGEEVAQLYLRSPDGCGDRRRHRLAGFRRFMLRARESRVVEFPLRRDDFAVCGEDGVFQVPACRQIAFVGGGQPGFARMLSIEVAAPDRE